MNLEDHLRMIETGRRLVKYGQRLPQHIKPQLSADVGNTDWLPYPESATIMTTTRMASSPAFLNFTDNISHQQVPTST